MADFTGFDNLSEDLKAKLIACSTPEEIIALAKSEGYEISSEQLESMAGGSSCTWHGYGRGPIGCPGHSDC